MSRCGRSLRRDAGRGRHPMITSTITAAVVATRLHPGGFASSTADRWHRVSPVAASVAIAPLTAPNSANAIDARWALAAKPTMANRGLNSLGLAYDAKQAKGAQPPRGTPR